MHYANRRHKYYCEQAEYDYDVARNAKDINEFLQSKSTNYIICKGRRAP